MTLNDLRQSLTAPEPPDGLTLALAGLWWDGKGDWTHESAQQDDGRAGARVIRIESVSLRIPMLSLVDTISCRIYSSRHQMKLEVEYASNRFDGHY